MNDAQRTIVEAHEGGLCTPAPDGLGCRCSTDYLMAGTVEDLEARAVDWLGIEVLRHHRAWCGLWDGRPHSCDEVTDPAALVDWWVDQAIAGAARQAAADEARAGVSW